MFLKSRNAAARATTLSVTSHNRTSHFGTAIDINFKPKSFKVEQNPGKSCSMDDIVAQFMAVTSADAPTSQQYLDASDWKLEPAVELYFASGGASIESQNQPAAVGNNVQVRERIEGYDDQLVDEEAQMFNEAMRISRRAKARARKPKGIFNQDRDVNLSEKNMSKHERRLANLFRPPFDIISDLSLDEAKNKAQETNRLLMVNVQDSGEFACQRLNRDLWRSAQIQEIVTKNFVFLQYDVEDPDGEDYRVLYPFESFPHIAILDPWTGEQQKTWSKVPTEPAFVEDIVDFVANAQGSQPSSSETYTKTDSKAQENNSGQSPRKIHREKFTPAAPSDPTALITPLDAPEPPQGPETTRIQLRYGDGKRTVRRFLLNDKVDTLFAVAKYVLGATGSIRLTSERRELQSDLGKTLQDANLKNSTVLVELD